jgi:AraC-like DNA-binding protein
MSFEERALGYLKQNISQINTVKEWATHFGYESEKYFSRQIRDLTGKRPKAIIIQVKLECIMECLQEPKDEILYCIARDLGFANDTALYKFVKRHTGKSPTELKRECEKRISGKVK